MCCCGFWWLPQSTEEGAGSGTHEYRQKEGRPAPRVLMAHPDWPASALLLQFLRSLEELQRKNEHVSIFRYNISNINSNLNYGYMIYSNIPSGLSGRPIPSQLMLHWLLTLEVREPKGWRGMVPMTRGRFRDKLIAPGMSTYTWTQTGGHQSRLK